MEQGLRLGLSSVKLTGGEPLIHPDIFAILAFIEATGLRLVLETNGLACTPEMAAAIRRCSNPFVSVSLDGARPETHNWVRGVSTAYDGALAGIRNLVEAGIRPQVIMSLVRRNRDQVEELVAMAEKIGVASIKFNLVAPLMERGEQLAEQNETLTIEEFIALGKKIEQEIQPGCKMRLSYSYPFAFKSLSALFEKNDAGRCGLMGIIGVIGSGKYALCGIGQNLPEMIFGDVRKDRLADVWNNHEMLNEIRREFPAKLEGICGDCILKMMCQGHCIASNYFVEHNLYAPFWFCNEAWKKNLFPASRLVPGSRFARDPKPEPDRPLCEK